MWTLTWTSTWTGLLEKNKNDLKSLKSSFTIHLTLTSKALPIQLILEAKNTDKKIKLQGKIT